VFLECEFGMGVKIVSKFHHRVVDVVE